MPPLQERISDDGPLITVGVGPSPLQAAVRAAGFSPPPPELVQALIDTGARVTCIDARIARALELRKTGTARMWTAGGTATRAVYDPNPYDPDGGACVREDGSGMILGHTGEGHASTRR